MVCLPEGFVYFGRYVLPLEVYPSVLRVADALPLKYIVYGQHVFWSNSSGLVGGSSLVSFCGSWDWLCWWRGCTGWG